MICANGFNENGITDVCQGDSGGPLTCNNKLVGLASFGVRCGFAMEFPGVFADVYFYRDWINANSGTGKTNLSLSFSVQLGFVTSFVTVQMRLFRS